MLNEEFRLLIEDTLATFFRINLDLIMAHNGYLKTPSYTGAHLGRIRPAVSIRFSHFNLLPITATDRKTFSENAPENFPVKSGLLYL